MPKETKFSIECWIYDINQKQFLLLKCPENDSHIAYWQPVTGGIESGENVKEACIREIREETGLSVTESEIVKLIDRFRVYKDEKELNKTIFLYKTETPRIVISDEHVDSRWVSAGAVDPLLMWGSNKRTFKVVTEYLDISLS